MYRLNNLLVRGFIAVPMLMRSSVREFANALQQNGGHTHLFMQKTSTVHTHQVWTLIRTQMQQSTAYSIQLEQLNTPRTYIHKDQRLQAIRSWCHPGTWQN
jgi:hypothetical protein